MSTRDDSRPGTEEEPVLVGVDLGGTKIAACLVTVSGQLRGEVHQVPTPGREGPAAMLAAIAGLVGQVVAAGTHGGRSPRPLAVGIGSAGIIDARSGVVLSATDAIAGWPGTNVADGVARLLPGAGVLAPDGQAPLVHVDNDVNAYAAGEAWLGAGHGASSALVVAVGTGVGGALVLGGAVHHGTHFLAGEIGHMPSQAAAGEPCTCGKSGHLEAIAAGPQIARRYREATGETSVTTALEVERRAQGGDVVAQRVYEEAAVALGRGIAQIVTAVDPQRVIISGGLARSGDLWWQPLRRTVADELIELIADSTELLPATLGTTAPIIGAAHEAWLRLPQAAGERNEA